jgi:hypothetical protein
MYAASQRRELHLPNTDLARKRASASKESHACSPVARASQRAVPLRRAKAPEAQDAQDEKPDRDRVSEQF